MFSDDGSVTLTSKLSNRLCQRVIETATPPSLQVEGFEIYFGKSILSFRPSLSKARQIFFLDWQFLDSSSSTLRLHFQIS